MEITDAKVNAKVLKFLIEIANTMRNGGTESESMIYDKGKFVYENRDKLPQYVYGELNYHTYKKDNKAPSKNETTLNTKVQEIIEELSLILKFDDIRELKSTMVGKECTKMYDDDEYLYIELTDKPKKNDPVDKVYNTVYYNIEKHTGTLDIPYTKQLGVIYPTISVNGKVINVDADNINLKLSAKSIVTGGNYNTLDCMRILKDDGEITLIDIVYRAMTEDELEFDKSIVTYADYHNIYNVVRTKID